MRLVLFNFESNKSSQVLAFALNWINEISKNVDKLYVVSLRCGEYAVNCNVEVHCINQENKTRLKTVLSIWKLLKNLHLKDNNIDGYFIHMAHYFVPIVYPFALLNKQQIVMWKTHTSKSFLVRVSTLLSNTIFSASPSSFPINTPKLISIGHGIDATNHFTFKRNCRGRLKNIVTVGRISRVKNTHLIVKSFLYLKRKDLFLYIVGDVLVESDNDYLVSIRSNIPKEFEQNIIFVGKVKFEKMPQLYRDMDLAVNLGDGGLDKAILEPMAMGIPVITSNESAKELFKCLQNNGVYLLDHKNDLTDRLNEVVRNNINFSRIELREEIIKNHSLNKLAKRIVSEFKNKN